MHYNYKGRNIFHYQNILHKLWYLAKLLALHFCNKITLPRLIGSGKWTPNISYYRLTIHSVMERQDPFEPNILGCMIHLSIAMNNFSATSMSRCKPSIVYSMFAIMQQLTKIIQCKLSSETATWIQCSIWCPSISGMSWHTYISVQTALLNRHKQEIRKI